MLSHMFLFSCSAKQESKQSSLGWCHGFWLGVVPFIGWMLMEGMA